MFDDRVLIIERISNVLVKEMFQVSEGETVAITVDAGSYFDIAEALFRVVETVGGKPLILHVPVARGDSEVGMVDWPVAPLTAALCQVDVWIELSSVIFLYSQIWEDAMQQNKSLRYLIIGNSSVESIQRVFTGYDIPTLSKLLVAVLDMAKQGKRIRITSQNGTDVSYDIDPEYAFDMDDGDYSKPIFGTAPGYINIVPKIGSMEGRIVFDELQNTNVYASNEEVEFLMKDGEIVQILGNDEASKFRSYLKAFEDPNMYKISHNMLGFNPGVRSLVGEIVEDERIWGGVDFGFGHTSPIDMPPHGQIAKSHFDGIVARTTIYIDGIKIVDNGEVCHPDLIPLANSLMNHIA